MVKRLHALTEVGAAKLKPTATRREVPDGGGLYLSVQPSGAKSWCVRYRRDGVARKYTIGPYPAVGLKAARELTKVALEAVAGGADPAADKRFARSAAADTSTELQFILPNFLDRYLTKKKRRPKPRTLEELARVFGLVRKNDAWQPVPGGLAAKWASRKVDAITKADVHIHLDALVARGVTAGANRALAALHLFFGWCLRRELVVVNPCAGIDRPAAETPRTRVLDDQELSLFWRASQSEPVFGPMLRLLCLTAQRRDEVRGMTWAEIDLPGGVWKIPAARVKNSREHVVPLSEAAITELKSTRRIGKLVFSTTGTSPMSGFSRAKRRLDAAMRTLAEGTIPPWTLHDLRRTAATGMARLGVDIPVIEKVLNHSGGTFSGIVGVYQHHPYTDEKRVALDKWAGFVLGLTHPTGIIR